jgi:UDP-N-acetylmuramate: L-alanyl-gamma-D-glutamyl-meso-diaminopimelate ligase
MILHVLNYHKIACDYMVGAQLEGFEVMVKLSPDAPFMVIEGDEYLTSPIDRRPKFHVYQPDIGIISGIAWDHINVFPTFENYVEQFQIFADMIPNEGTFIYCKTDENCCKIAAKRKHPQAFGYELPIYKVENHTYYINVNEKWLPLQLFGKHNLLNMNAARLACNTMGVSDAQFYEAILTFKGASKRLELVKGNEYCAVYKDFAHSPSKLLATIDAVKDTFPDRKLVACVELHTFSSLTAEFLLQYKDTMNKADEAFVYFNPHTIAHKKLPPITEEMIYKAFNNKEIRVFQDSKALLAVLLAKKWKNANLLLMSSGNFDGVDYGELADNIMINH